MPASTPRGEPFMQDVANIKAPLLLCFELLGIKFEDDAENFVREPRTWNAQGAQSASTTGSPTECSVSSSDFIPRSSKHRSRGTLMLATSCMNGSPQGVDSGTLRPLHPFSVDFWYFQDFVGSPKHVP